MSTITIERRTQYADRIRAYLVKIDGKTVSKISAGEKVSLKIQAGSHELVVTIDWCRSNKVKFVAPDDEELNFQCGNSFIDSRPYLALVYATLLRHRYLWLRRV